MLFSSSGFEVITAVTVWCNGCALFCSVNDSISNLMSKRLVKIFLYECSCYQNTSSSWSQRSIPYRSSYADNLCTRWVDDGFWFSSGLLHVQYFYCFRCKTLSHEISQKATALKNRRRFWITEQYRCSYWAINQISNSQVLCRYYITSLFTCIARALFKNKIEIGTFVKRSFLSFCILQYFRLTKGILVPFKNVYV